jgi:hypothetical protein
MSTTQSLSDEERAARVADHLEFGDDEYAKHKAAYARACKHRDMTMEEVNEFVRIARVILKI